MKAAEDVRYPDFDNIPEVLRERRQWVVWCLEPKQNSNDLAKVPYCASTGHRASSTDPQSWRTFEKAVAAIKRQPGRWAGIGFVITADEDLCGIDLDGCIDAHGVVSPWALEIVEAIATYWEQSPSGTGLRGFLRGTLPPTKEKKKKWKETVDGVEREFGIEIYREDRFLTVTGRHWAGTPTTIEHQQTELTALHARLWPPKAQKTSANGRRPTAQPPDDDEEVIDHLRRMECGAKFSALFDGGGISDDHSSDRWSLLNYLYWRTRGDRSQMDRLMRRSALLQDAEHLAKWDSRRGETTLGWGEIDKRITEGGEVYEPRERMEDVDFDVSALYGDDGEEDDTEEPEEPGGEDKPPKKRRAKKGIGGNASEKPPPLWKQWVTVLNDAGAELLWTDQKEAYFQLSSGEVMAVSSDDAALWMQERADRQAYHGSDVWRRAAGAVRSYARETGKKATVHRMAFADWQNRIAYLGCEDGSTVYRVTARGIEKVQNGTDEVLIVGGRAPVLAKVEPSGEIAKWLKEKTWATPVSQLTAAILAVKMTLGAQSYDARPLIVARGPSQSGKTTTLQMMGSAIYGGDTIAQGIKSKEEQNESRIVNESLAIFDNLDQPPRDVAVEDFLAIACTQQRVSIRKMRVEGEVVEKPVTAFTAVTSFSMPRCLKRGDVVNRAVILDFERPDKSKTRKMGDRRPDRTKFWGDLLTLVQRAMANWDRVPQECEHRSIEFIQFAHALLPAESAGTLERHMLALQGSMAGTNDLILDKLEETPPADPMTAAELYNLWWPLFLPDDNRPKSHFALGSLLGHRQGRLGGWIIKQTGRNEKDTPLWSFEKVNDGSILSDEDSARLLKGLVRGEP